MRTRRRRGGVLVSPGGLPAGLPVDAGERGDVHGVPLAQLTPLGERCRVGELGGEPADFFRGFLGQRPRDLEFAGGGGDNLRKACPRCRSRLQRGLRPVPPSRQPDQVHVRAVQHRRLEPHRLLQGQRQRAEVQAQGSG